MRVQIRSRTGSIVLGVLGVVYLIAAVALLVLYVLDTWSAAALLDRLLQFALAAAAFISLWFISIAMTSLGISLRGRRDARTRRAGAEGAS
ncbi:MAG TPA: hypothetical protein VMS98_08340 [Thermoanaerobaculia bacterium]|nr:hypothetical protein [Thermoanaerobaculia bacterium]